MKLGELAAKIGAELTGDPLIEITGVGTLEGATPTQITFLTNAKYKKYLAQTKAAAVIVQATDNETWPVATLACRDPKLASALALQILYPSRGWPSLIHSSAVIGEQCEIDPSCFVGPHCVIGNRVRIGKDAVLQAGCHIGDDVVIGAGTTLLPNVCVYQACEIGEQCMIHSGVVIGSDGFGFAKHQDKWIKVPQVGAVIIGNRVEIGANTTIDRGAIEDTEISDDVILDNLIHIAHNVKIGQGTAIAACSGIAGSTTIGKHCLIGGGSRINGHIQITDFVTIVGCTNVAQSITQAGAYASGISENNIRTWKKNLARFHQLDDLALRLIQLEKNWKLRRRVCSVLDSNKLLKIDEVIKYLPHRYPFLMIDKVIDHQETSLRAIKNVTVNEPYFTGHFPGNPVMPGVMIIECLAQAAAILAYVRTESSPRDSLFYLAAIDDAKFKQMVIPGDQLVLDVHIVGSKANFWKIHGEATVEGKIVCSVDILSAMRKVSQ